MATPRGLRVRRSFRDVQQDHLDAVGDPSKRPTELDKLILAFKGIQALPPTDPNSFFVIAGYHGEPFRGVSISIQYGNRPCSHALYLRLASLTAHGGEVTAIMGKFSFLRGIEPT